MNEAQVILVSNEDEAIGVMEKMEAHRKGLLHRAFSIFIFDSDGQMLLQQRAAEKYHGGLLWTNACCSHPSPGEETFDAAERRLSEELGFTTKLMEIFSFRYRAEVENGLIEHELDHVFTGIYEEEISINPHEVKAVRFEKMENIRKDLCTHPEKYTSWFALAFPRIEAWWEDQFSHVALKQLKLEKK